jgi:hypothetical protein
MSAKNNGRPNPTARTVIQPRVIYAQNSPTGSAAREPPSAQITNVVAPPCGALFELRAFVRDCELLAQLSYFCAGFRGALVVPCAVRGKGTDRTAQGEPVKKAAELMGLGCEAGRKAHGRAGEQAGGDEGRRAQDRGWPPHHAPQLLHMADGRRR